MILREGQLQQVETQGGSGLGEPAAKPARAAPLRTPGLLHPAGEEVGETGPSRVSGPRAALSGLSSSCSQRCEFQQDPLVSQTGPRTCPCHAH